MKKNIKSALNENILLNKKNFLTNPISRVEDKHFKYPRYIIDPF